MNIDAVHRNALLGLARESIEHGFTHHTPLEVNLADYDEALHQKRATFVTLLHLGALRGCIGMLEATRPLVEDIAVNAFGAAFKDPRFPPLAPRELNGLDIEISILSPLERLRAGTREELLMQLHPGRDGLVIVDLGHRATFLPKVWEKFADKETFLSQLLIKAGLAPDHWSHTIECYRYTTETFGTS